MLTETSHQHSTPMALDQATRLACSLLPNSSNCFERISAETALEAVDYLKTHNHSQDEQLAALLWLFPAREVRSLAPDYLISTIEALPKLWKEILPKLGRLPDETTVRRPLSQAPLPAYTIASAYLYVLNEHGRRQIYESPDRLTEALPIKQLLKNLLALARELAEKDPYITANQLVASVCASIEDAALIDDLLPESTWVWAVRSNTESPDSTRPSALQSLRRFIREFWLTTGSYPEDHPLADKVFFVRIEKDRTGAEGAIDRLMTSLAIRFPLLFVIRKEPFTAELKTVRWGRTPILSWHQGLGYSGRRQCLLKSKAADPLSEFIRFKRSTSLAEQRQQLVAMTS